FRWNWFPHGRRHRIHFHFLWPKRGPAATAFTNSEIPAWRILLGHQSGAHSIERHAVCALFLPRNGRSVARWRHYRRTGSRHRYVSVPDPRAAEAKGGRRVRLLAGRAARGKGWDPAGGCPVAVADECNIHDDRPKGPVRNLRLQWH